MVTVNPPNSVVDYATEAIRAGILSGRYPLGSRLDQNGLAQDLQTSVVPIREALRGLEAEGLLSFSPRRGAFVTGLSPEELREIYLIRESLDELAVRHAVPNLTAEDHEKLRSLVEEMQAATNAQDHDRLMQLNREFHFFIYRAAGMPRLVQLISNLWDRYSLYSRIYLPGHATSSTHDHSEILRACIRGDAERASHLTRAHIESASKAMLATVGRLP